MLKKPFAAVTIPYWQGDQPHAFAHLLRLFCPVTKWLATITDDPSLDLYLAPQRHPGARAVEMRGEWPTLL